MFILLVVGFSGGDDVSLESRRDLDKGSCRRTRLRLMFHLSVRAPSQPTFERARLRGALCSAVRLSVSCVGHSARENACVCA